MPRPEQTIFLNPKYRELKKQIKRICIDRGLTQMQAVYEALQDWIKKHGAEK